MSSRLCSVEIDRITVYPFGADMSLRGKSSYAKDIIIALSGPFVNLILFLLGIRLGLGIYFTVCNLVLCYVNLLPVKGLDGGVILQSLLYLILPIRAAEICLKAVTLILLFTAWLFSVYFLFREGSDPSLFVIVCALFASVIRREDAESR